MADWHWADPARSPVLLPDTSGVPGSGTPLFEGGNEQATRHPRTAPAGLEEGPGPGGGGGHSAAGVTSRALCSGLCLWLLLRQWRRRKAHQKGMDLQMMRDLSGLPPIDLDKLDRDLRSPRIHVVSGRIHGCTEAMAVGMPSCLRARARALCLLGVEAACAHVYGGVRACVWCCAAAVFGRSFRRQRICASPS